MAVIVFWPALAVGDVRVLPADTEITIQAKEDRPKEVIRLKAPAFLLERAAVDHINATYTLAHNLSASLAVCREELATAEKALTRPSSSWWKWGALGASLVGAFVAGAYAL